MGGRGRQKGTNREKKGVPCQCENLSASVFNCKVVDSGQAILFCFGSLCSAPTPTVPVPPFLHLLGVSSFQKSQVVVLFSHSKFEATHRVVEVKGGIPGGHGTGAGQSL